LSKLNRKPENILYISAHALESCLQHESCVNIKPWKLETDDTQLLDLIPFLECKCSNPLCIGMQWVPLLLSCEPVINPDETNLYYRSCRGTTSRCPASACCLSRSWRSCRVCQAYKGIGEVSTWLHSTAGSLSFKIFEVCLSQFIINAILLVYLYGWTSLLCGMHHLLWAGLAIAYFALLVRLRLKQANFWSMFWCFAGLGNYWNWYDAYSCLNSKILTVSDKPGTKANLATTKQVCTMVFLGKGKAPASTCLHRLMHIAIIDNLLNR
jgi:hypothetical protein